MRVHCTVAYVCDDLYQLSLCFTYNLTVCFIINASICICYFAASSQELFFPHETEQFVRLFRHGVVALDIYRVTSMPSGGHVLRNAKSAECLFVCVM